MQNRIAKDTLRGKKKHGSALKDCPLKFHYADGIVVLAKRKRAAERLPETMQRYLEGRLKHKMSEFKLLALGKQSWYNGGRDSPGPRRPPPTNQEVGWPK